MLAHVVRKKFIVKIPVGRQFQQQFDANVAKIRNAVVPILALKGGKPVTVGSAVLIDIDGRAFFVTALHVLEDNKPLPLAVFNADRLLVPIEGEFTTERNYDLAVLPLDRADGLNFSPKRFLKPANIRASQPSGRQYAAIVGYPATKTKIFEASFIDTEMFSMADFVREEKDGRMWVKFDKRRVTFVEPRRWVTAPDPYGMSGGAIFAAPVLSIMPTFSPEAKLAGIATHWRYKRKLFEGTNAETLCAFLAATS